MKIKSSSSAGAVPGMGAEVPETTSERPSGRTPRGVGDVADSYEAQKKEATAEKNQASRRGVQAASTSSPASATDASVEITPGVAAGAPGPTPYQPESPESATGRKPGSQ